MRFARIRSGLAETTHEVACIAIEGSPPSRSRVVFASGPIDTPFFYRSAIKPFQALAAARTGLELPDEHLALTCASHGGYPVHLAIVDQILSDHGLDRDDLRCTPDRPSSPGARSLQAQAGHAGREQRFHNCSGKHAGWLAACVLAGWDTASYLDPHHAIQVAILDVLRDVTDVEPEPTGVDGCGAPTLRGNLTGLARAFLRLGADPELRPMANAMRRFGALVADNVRSDGQFTVTCGWPSKVGAEGLFGVAGPGLGIAAKSLEGDAEIAIAAAIEVASHLGILTEGMADRLTDARRPPQMGAGRSVGSLELVEM
jgi:L-asparaginase II